MANEGRLMMTNLHFGMQAWPAPIRVLSYTHVPGQVILHGHEFFELVLVSGGEALHETVDAAGELRRLPIGRGNVLLLSEGEQHTFRIEEGHTLSVCNILFADRVMERLAGRDDPDSRDLRVLTVLFDRSAAFRLGESVKIPDALLEKLLSLAADIGRESDGGYGSSAMQVLLFGQIMAEIGRFVETHFPGDPLPAKGALHAALDYIHRHYAEEISLSTLAGLAICSPRHLSRQFRALTGETVGQYIRRLRISRACYLLRHSNLQNNQIALSVGYQEYAGFVRAFRTELGITPSEYREGEFDDDRAMQFFNRFF